MPVHDRRSLIEGAALFAMLGLTEGASAQGIKPAFPLDFRGKGKIPWFKRIFHLYSGSDGLTRIENLPTNAPLSGEIGQFLRRSAERVSIGGTSAGAGFDFHVANQPTLLIPIFGSMLVGLHDGSLHEFGHGDMLYAEDCTGKGHISRSGPRGSFVVQVQLPKRLCPAVGSSDRAKLWSD
jgi:hypothetical protein